MTYKNYDYVLPIQACHKNHSCNTFPFKLANNQHSYNIQLPSNPVYSSKLYESATSSPGEELAEIVVEPEEALPLPLESGRFGEGGDGIGRDRAAVKFLVAFSGVLVSEKIIVMTAGNKNIEIWGERDRHFYCNILSLLCSFVISLSQWTILFV